MPHAKPHVRGAGVYNVPASTSYRLLALLLDLGLGISVFFGLFVLFRWIPMPGAMTAALLAIFTVALWGSQKFFFGLTLGERVWGLRTQTKFALNPPLLQ
jgi:hypothetical protein